MAKLENLEVFDREFKLCSQDLRSLQTLLATEPKTWSPQQAAHISKLLGGITHLADAVANVVSHNR